ncbi:MAG: hypothetical protein FJ271_33115 [Planctomycetes bacterium]|nr:hypothetical protein [Planctomycetota bacterium]
MKTQKQVEYDVRTLDEYGAVADVDSFYRGDGRVRNYAHSKRHAIEFAQRIVRDGGTAVVERTIYTIDVDEDKIVDMEHEQIWSGGDYDSLVAGGWLVAGDSEGGAA